MNDVLLDEIIDPGSEFEAGVHLNQGFGPERFVGDAPFYEFVEIVLADLNEAAHIIRVFMNYGFTETKYVHSTGSFKSNRCAAGSENRGTVLGRVWVVAALSDWWGNNRRTLTNPIHHPVTCADAHHLPLFGFR